MPLDDIRDNDGNIWKLGWRPPTTNQLKLRSSQTSLSVLRGSQGMSSKLPRSEWKPLSFIKGYPLSLIEDQTGIGSCSAFTATGAGNRQRHMRGQPYERLSGFWLYDQCNGGSDNGSNIGEVNEVVLRQGVPPMTAYPHIRWQADQDPQGVPYYKEDQKVTLTDFDDLATLILAHGGLGQFPIDAANMQRFTNSGIGIGRGSNPNHSVYAAGVDYIDGQWVLEVITSWRENWGPFKAGWWYVTERQVNDCAAADDANGHISTLTPQGISAGLQAPIPV